jgi:hypothetical protein
MSAQVVFWVCVATLCGCDATSSRLPSDAYVWHRQWSPELREALQRVPDEVSALRILFAETGPAAATVPVERVGPKPLIAVMRVEGGLPTDAEVDAFVARARAFGAAQIEFDFDSPTAALGAWVERLQAIRSHAPGLRLSVTALPTWVDSPHVVALAKSVDEVVLQVHTVRAPVLFDATQAVEDARRWWAATRQPFRVALPAYRATLRDGRGLSAEPVAVAAAMQALERVGGVRGFVFFRLGPLDDRLAWSPATLRAVLRREPLPTDGVAIELAANDVWLVNRSPIDAEAPLEFTVAGNVVYADGTTGYGVEGRGHFSTTQRLWLRPFERIRVGIVRGEHLHVTSR